MIIDENERDVGSENLSNTNGMQSDNYSFYLAKQYEAFATS